MLGRILMKLLKWKGYGVVPLAGLKQKSQNPKMMQLDPIGAGRFLYLHSLLQKTASVPGEIVECGVGHARSLTLMALSVLLANDKRNIWGFDSFEGFDEPSEEDKSGRNPKAGEYAVSLPEVMSIISAHIDNEQFVRSRITLVKGFFHDTLERTPLDKISFLNLDVDLYDPYKYCLEMLWPKMSKGAIVTFDEYVRESWRFPGSMKAINDFFEDKPVTFERDPYYGKYYVVKNCD